MQIILILFLLNFSQNYYLLSDMKNLIFHTPPEYENIKFSYLTGGGVKKFLHR